MPPRFSASRQFPRPSAARCTTPSFSGVSLINHIIGRLREAPFALFDLLVRPFYEYGGLAFCKPPTPPHHLHCIPAQRPVTLAPRCSAPRLGTTYFVECSLCQRALVSSLGRTTAHSCRTQPNQSPQTAPTRAKSRRHPPSVFNHRSCISNTTTRHTQ